MSNQLIFPEIPEDLHTAICEKLTMPSPKWHENERMRRWNGKTPQLLRLYERAEFGLVAHWG